MNPEQIRADLARAAALNDQFYKKLAPILGAWTQLAMTVQGAIPYGTTKDTSAITEQILNGSNGIHMVADASIYLGQALTSLAAEF